MKVKELIEKLAPYEDYEIQFTVSEELTKEELAKMPYPYPYRTIRTQLQVKDIGHADKIVSLGCEI